MHFNSTPRNTQLKMTAPTVIMMRFDLPRHCFKPGQVPRPELLTMLQVLKMESDVVHNACVDIAAVERLVLAGSPQEAMECAFRSGLGSNIKEVYTADGTKYFKRGNAETTLPNKRQPVPRLGMDVAQAMQSLSERATQAAAAVKAAKATVGAAKARVEKIKKEQARLQGERVQMRKKLARAEGLVEELSDELARRREESEVADVSQLQAEIQQLEVSMGQARTRLENVQGEIVKAEALVAECQRAMHAEAAAGKTLATENEKLLQEYQAASNAVEATRGDVVKARAYKQKVEEKIAERRRKCEVAKADLATLCAEAAQVCTEAQLEAAGGMDERDNAVTLLNNELSRLRRTIAKEETRILAGASVEEMEYQLETETKAYLKLKTLVDMINRPMLRMKESIKLRKGMLLSTAKSTGKAVSHQFNAYMGKRGHSGRIKVDHNHGTLQMEVVMAGTAAGGSKKGDVTVKNTKTLSGGERSYSTLAFTLALGKSNESPFRAMDEFDVFMDAVNRRIGTEHLIRFAKEHRHLQFIYLTPQDVSMLNKDIIKLEEGFINVQKLQNAKR
jgi:chromosome segregation ATPase